MAGIVNFRDANINQSDDAQTGLFSPANMDGSGWAVATGRGTAQGGAIDKSNGIGGLTIALGAAAVLGVVLLMRRKG
jgi:hypothetical protein